jgi:hypothetical protein
MYNPKNVKILASSLINLILFHESYQKDHGIKIVLPYNIIDLSKVTLKL